MPEPMAVDATLSVAQRESVDAAWRRLEERGVSAKLFALDPSAWSGDADVQEQISNSLGWIGVLQKMQTEADGLRRFADEIRREGFEDVVLLGMGGSSLAPIVLRGTLGVVAGFPKLHVIDTTDLEFIRSVEHSINLEHALFIVASKSGGTIEPSTLSDFFWAKTGNRGAQFVAITDPETELARQATERDFRRTFLNPPDIGGRYSALSFFGLVPAALLGHDPEALLRPALDLIRSDSDKSSAAWLGTALGALALEGRDKATFVLGDEIGSFGLWTEQLIAESTGKQGRGIVPVAGESVGQPGVYRADRVFIAIDVAGGSLTQSLETLSAAGHPVLRLQMKGTNEIGAEFLRWEIATAIAGAVLEINPFDQPNVQESKDNTARLLQELESTGKLPEAGKALASNGIAVYGGEAPTAEMAVRSLLESCTEGGFLALMAYVSESEDRQQKIDTLRTRLRDHLGVATTFGYGPRFLHSTGQLHKGGRQNGAFIQLVSSSAEDLPIPGKPFSFGQLKAAQALGDLQALQSRGRPVLRIDLGSDADAGLDAALSLFNDALD